MMAGGYAVGVAAALAIFADRFRFVRSDSFGPA